MTVVAFGTSAPEIAVSVGAAPATVCANVPAAVPSALVAIEDDPESTFAFRLMKMTVEPTCCASQPSPTVEKSAFEIV